MKEKETVYELRASEVKLTYNNRIKPSDRVCIKNAEDAAQLMFEYWDFDTIEHVEEMKMLLLNRSHKVLGIVNLSKGGAFGTTVDVRIILQYALKANASAIILAHNHPSGSLRASESDQFLTKRVSDAVKLLDIHLLDHIIITADRQYGAIESSDL